MSRVTTADDVTPATKLLKHYVRVLRRRWMLVALLSLGVVAAAALAIRMWNPPYQARAVVQVPTTWTGSLADVRLDVGYTERLLNTYVALSESGRLDGRVAVRLPDLDTSSLTISLDIPANTELLIAEASASTPELAATGANAAAEMLVEEIRDDLNARFAAASESLQEQIKALDGRIADIPQSDGTDAGAVLELRNELLEQRELLQRDFNQVRALSQAASSGVAIVEMAEPPSSRPSVTLLITAAAIIGLAGAVLLVIVIDRLDETVFEVDDVTTQHGYTVLGEVVTSAGRGEHNGTAMNAALAIDPQALGLAYRLKTASPRTLMTTSVHWDYPTVSYAAELCRALASTGLKLVVVDTAIAKTRLATLLGVERHHGDPRSGSSKSVAADTTQPTKNDNLHVASARWAVQFIGMSDYPRKALDRLESDFDLVVVFVPGLLDRAEASLMGKAVEGTLLLVGEGAVNEDDLRASFRQIESLPSRFLGVVVGKHHTRRIVH
jgi:capsular polysaccharide biosynthesis protein